jgi:hypothetical protein
MGKKNGAFNMGNSGRREKDGIFGNKRESSATKRARETNLKKWVFRLNAIVCAFKLRNFLQ